GGGRVDRRHGGGQTVFAGTARGSEADRIGPARESATPGGPERALPRSGCQRRHRATSRRSNAKPARGLSARARKKPADRRGGRGKISHPDGPALGKGTRRSCAGLVVAPGTGSRTR